MRGFASLEEPRGIFSIHRPDAANACGSHGPALPRRGMLALLPASLAGVTAHAQTAPEPAALTRHEIAAWHDKLYDSTNAFNAPGGGSSALRGWAMVALAMFEAANAIDGRYRAYAVP